MAPLISALGGGQHRSGTSRGQQAPNMRSAIKVSPLNATVVAEVRCVLRGQHLLGDVEIREVSQSRVRKRANHQPAVQEAVELLATRFRKKSTTVAGGKVARIGTLSLLASVHAGPDRLNTIERR